MPQVTKGHAMRDEDKTKRRLVDEITEARRLNRELLAAEAELHTALESLRDSEEKFRAVAQSAIDAIISTDSKDNVIFWNRGAQNIFGYTEEEMIGRSVVEIVPEPYKEAHRRGIRRFVATGMPALIGRTVELEGVKKDGRVFPIELSLSHWKTGEGVFFTGIIRDISYRKEVQRELERRTREARQRTEELENFIQMVAHDLKSPVITIGGLVRLLSRKCDGPSERTDAILKQLSSASGFIEKFLEDLLAGLSVDHVKPDVQVFDLAEVVIETVEQHRAALDERRVTLRMTLPDDIPQVKGERRRFVQVIDNLIANAYKHMGEAPDPQIRVTAAVEGDFVRLTVQDNGKGIPKQYLRRVFDCFFRLDKAVSGTGLGLSISKKIVESHGGVMDVDSDEGKGAAFTFTIPCA
jgi:PAS domain S-box-containing protein